MKTKSKKEIWAIIAITLAALPCLGQVSGGSFRTVRPVLPATTVHAGASVSQPILHRAQPVFNAKRMQALRRMEQDLAVIKTTKTAWMEFDANRIFNYGQPTLKSSAKPLLDKVLNYLCLSCGKGVTVQYQVAFGKDSCQMGRARSDVLMKYLAGKTRHLSPGWFCAKEPEIIRQITTPGQRFPGEVRRREHKSLVNIHVIR